MEHSEQLGELIVALSKAQGQFEPVNKSKENPHLKYKYATLDNIIETVKKPLADNGLAWVQVLGGGENMTLTTTLMHTSGQWISATVAIPPPVTQKGINALQSLGSSITYMKRYALSAMLGISSDEDDDAQASDVAHPAPKKARPERQKGEPPKKLKSIQEAAFETTYDEAVAADIDMVGYIAYIGDFLEGAGFSTSQERMALLTKLFGSEVKESNDLKKHPVGAWRLVERYALYVSEGGDREQGASIVRRGINNRVDWDAAAEMADSEIVEEASEDVVEELPL
jgi:hypothetical protein